MPEEKQKTPAEEAKEAEQQDHLRQRPHYHKPDPNEDKDDDDGLFNDMPV